MTSIYMKAFYVLVALGATMFMIVGCFAQTRYPPPPSRQRPPYNRKPRVRPLVAVPAFRLFPPNAAISLTDDNSTFFLARPAAFGPELRDKGLSAVLWIGAGFGEDGIEPQGELGCSDVPGWDSKRAADGAPVLPTDGQLDDGTDDYLEGFATEAYHRSTRKPGQSKAEPADGREHADGATTTALVPTETNAAVDIWSNTPSKARKSGASRDSSESTNIAMGKSNADNHINAKKGGKNSKNSNGNMNVEGSRHGDIQSLQEGAEIAGKIVLLRRGGCGFLAKVMWAQRRGAVAVIVGDDRKGGPLIQMYAAGDTSGVHIPSVFTAHTTAHLLTALAAAAARDDDITVRKKVEPLETTKTKTVTQTPQPTTESDSWFWKTKQREWILDEYVPTETTVSSQTTATPATSTGRAGDAVGSSEQDHDHALWVTIAPARSGLPLVDTLLVVIASPLLAIVTITVVLLFVRSQCRYRAWRAPKALVAQLPVHTYCPPGAVLPGPVSVPVGYDVSSPLPSRPSSPVFNPEPSITTPLLQRPRSRTTTGVPGDELRANMAIPLPPPAPPSRYYQAECVVCLEEYVAGDQVMSLPCGHEFHASCITPWLTTRRRTCPICKGDVVRGAQGEA